MPAPYNLILRFLNYSVPQNSYFDFVGPQGEEIITRINMVELSSMFILIEMAKKELKKFVHAGYRFH